MLNLNISVASHSLGQLEGQVDSACGANQAAHGVKLKNKTHRMPYRDLFDKDRPTLKIRFKLARVPLTSQSS